MRYGALNHFLIEFTDQLLNCDVELHDMWFWILKILAYVEDNTKHPHLSVVGCKNQQTSLLLQTSMEVKTQWINLTEISQWRQQQQQPENLLALFAG